MNNSQDNRYFLQTNSNALALVFNHELSGQISDGYWENSKPYDHWKAFNCGVEVVDDNSNKMYVLPNTTDVYVRVNTHFYKQRNYNFASRELYNIVGNRMFGLYVYGMYLDSNPQEVYDENTCRSVMEVFEAININNCKTMTNKNSTLNITTLVDNAYNQLFNNITSCKNQYNTPDSKTSYDYYSDKLNNINNNKDFIINTLVSFLNTNKDKVNFTNMKKMLKGLSNVVTNYYSFKVINK